MNQSIESTLRDLLVGVTPLPPEFSADSDLLEDAALESAQVMEFIMEVEDHFDIIVPQAELGEVRTLAQLAQLVVRSLQ